MSNNLAQASRDENRIPTLLAVSSVDGTTPVALFADPTTHRLLVDLPAGAGDVTGDTASVDKEFVRFNGTTGKVIESPNTDNSSVTATLSDNVDVTFYDATNDGNPEFSFGSSATNRLLITSVYDSGAQTLDYVEIATDSAGEGDLVLSPASGFVGVGTTTPDIRLVTAVSSGVVGFAVDQYSTTANQGSFFVLRRSKSANIGTDLAVTNNDNLGGFFAQGYSGSNYANAGAVQTVVDGSVSSGVVPGRMNFRVANSAGTLTTRLTVKADGKIGVGTSTPDTLFHVEEDSSATNSVTNVLRLTSTSSGTPAAGIGVGMEFEVETAAANNEIGAVIEVVATDVTSTDEDFAFRFKTMLSGDAATEKVRITAEGRVGIGEVAPQRSLHIAGDGILIERSANSPVIALKNISNGSIEGRIFVTADGTNTGYMSLTDEAAAVLMVLKDGQVGIGTVAPDHPLHVEKDSAATNTVTRILSLTSTSSGTPAAGIGVGMTFEAETAAGNNEIGGTIDVVATDVDPTNEDFDMVFNTMLSGDTAVERMRLQSDGALDLPTGGDFQINGASILNATTLGSAVVASSLTSVGTVTTGTWDSTLKITIAAKTGNYTVLTGDSNTLFTNEAAVGAVIFALPTAAAGLTYEFYIQAAQTVTVTANTGDTIRNAGTVTASAGNFSDNTVGNLLKITAINATEWVTETIVGTWTAT